MLLTKNNTRKGVTKLGDKDYDFDGFFWKNNK
jgi:hypothetical protein